MEPLNRAKIHFFMCSWCQSTATCTTLAEDTHIDCPLCRRWMALKFSYAVQTDEDRALAARGLVLNPHLADDPNRTGICTTCRQRVKRSELINLSAAGKFCSTACADIGTEKHERFMRRQQELLEAQALRERPWLRQKESA